MADPEQHERESRESGETKFEQLRERGAEERAELTERLPEPPAPEEEKNDD